MRFFGCGALALAFKQLELRVRLLPPLCDYAGVETDGAADEPARDDVRLRLAVNRDRMEMKNPGNLTSSEGSMIGEENLGDQCWV